MNNTQNNSDAHRFDGTVSLAVFRNKIESLYSGCSITTEGHSENGSALTLFYVNDGHCGTWQSGSGVIFSTTRVERNIKTSKDLTDFMSTIDVPTDF
ncbi:hypothetical protein P3602_24745 [Vibrio parahaemolyticus]|uniref:hypothetical protein n=1 Tax=Vibrio TaxID=662 RepID=UPI001B821B31|nr:MULTISPECIES: hypothetical protein [Vibrio]MCA2422242.1 hypothetical protein [Vibrio alginolyticus]MCA2446881.1 hypothetical protein [Vibrio alginolyticus]MCR9821630.1 hypothetical protein [Vibrio parahaemolyticus]MDF5109122.1 hypothetical protein [Vibrio parahaemolyticus]MDF5144027.1 hypothetical protein [Vibrio parahaemolyticus]